MKPLTGVEVNTDLALDATNRRDLILSLKFEYGYGMDMFAPEIPARIRWVKVSVTGQNFFSGLDKAFLQDKVQ